MMVPTTGYPWRRRSFRILIVEDDPDTRWTLVRTLEIAGYDTRDAGSGEEALAELELRPYDVMLLDLHLPDRDGLEILEKANKYQPELLVIVVTGRPTLESAITGIRARVADYLRKPIRGRELLHAIATALAKQAEWRSGLVELGATLAKEELSPDAPEHVPEGTVRIESGGNVLFFDAARRQVHFAGDVTRVVDLTEGETAILASLLDRSGEVVSCQEIVYEAWGEELETVQAESIIRPYIFRLRQKLELNSRTPRLILTVRGQGYTFVTD